jgi:hypothetical protein
VIPLINTARSFSLGFTDLYAENGPPLPFSACQRYNRLLGQSWSCSEGSGWSKT